MRKTKIVCTIGPASSDEATIARLIDAGMDVARLNFSHNTLEWHGEVLRLVREAARASGREIAVLQDLPGPKIRTGDGGEIVLIDDTEVDILPGVNVTDEGEIGCSYAELGGELSAGSSILLSDGFLELEVLESTPERVRCRVMRGGLLKSRQGMNLPGADLSAHPPTEEDVEFIKWGIEAGVDYIALSFVKGAEDVERAREAAGDGAKDVRFVAKIERKEALDGLDDILDAADAIMVARGDLGVELPPEQVPSRQRDMIRSANAADKPVITATQMLESMISRARPTRAEVSDVAHAIWDGTDAVMLSGETATGRYPVESCSLMERIAREAEREAPGEGVLGGHALAGGAQDVMGVASSLVARSLGAKAIVAATMSGDTARFCSMARPACPILALSPVERARRRMALYRGVIPVRIEGMDETGALADVARRAGRQLGFAEAGDLLVLVFGEPVGTGVKANTVRVVHVRE